MTAARVPTGAAALWLLAVVAVVWFALLGHRDLRDPDEGRYAEIAREMVATGDWLTPRLNGFKYFEKPPLQYWATAALFSVFGESNLTARLWIASIGFLGGLWIWFVGWRLFGAYAGVNAFLVLTSSFMYVANAHFITLDMTLTVFMSVAVGALAIAQSKRGHAALVRRWMLLGWAALGLAVLAKGPIGLVLPGAAVSLYVMWQRDWSLLRHLHLGAGLATFLAVVAPWFIAVSIANPEFPSFFFIHEHLQRYSTDVHRRDAPFYYFVPVLLVGGLPWLAAVTREITRPHFDWWPKGGQGFEPERFLWIYAAFIVLFFSFSHSKLPPYILPAFPALALLVGRRLVGRTSFRAESITLGIMAVALFLAAMGLSFMPPDLSRAPAELVGALAPWLVGGGAVVLGGAFAVARLRQPVLTLVIVSVCSLVMLQMVAVGFRAIEQQRSNRQLADVIGSIQDAQTEVFSVGLFEPSLAFYLGRTVTLVKYQGELAFGIDQEPGNFLPALPNFENRWKAATRAVAVFRAEDEDSVDLDGLGGRLVFRDPRRFAIAKP